MDRDKPKIPQTGTAIGYRASPEH